MPMNSTISDKHAHFGYIAVKMVKSFQHFSLKGQGFSVCLADCSKNKSSDNCALPRWHQNV